MSINLPNPPGMCPVSGEPLIITELSNESGSIQIRGKFAMPNASQLNEEQQNLLESFLAARGNLSVLERHLGMSYPTLRNRVDDLIGALGLTPLKESKRATMDPDERQRILDALERGELTAEEAKSQLKEKQS
ncbi:MAG: DUF2089 domain-containing protein [Fimbriimonadaceae bacterium]|nr:DUF2089 domain-containing protein [Fimbriimonadaceae bacterium]